MKEMNWQGFWFALLDGYGYFVIVNSKNKGRVYDEVGKEFSKIIVPIGQNGSNGKLKLYVRRCGEERTVRNTQTEWPPLSEEDRLFIES